MTRIPNACRANHDRRYMTWSQLRALQNRYHWEIGSHTIHHYCLASSALEDPSDCQDQPLTAESVDEELRLSQSALANHGLRVRSFAPPYGDYDLGILADAAKYYTSLRQFKNAASSRNVWPYSDYYIQDRVVLEGTDAAAAVERAILKTIADHQWLVLTFHDVVRHPSLEPDAYQYGSGELRAIARFAANGIAAGVLENDNVTDGLLVGDGINLLPGGDFRDGISEGWRTDAPVGITADADDRGAYPDPKHSVRLASAESGRQTHLFSPLVHVRTETTYVFKTFLNVATISSGAVGFYVDEYDADGNWINGAYEREERSRFVEDMNFSYTPTRPDVSWIGLQIIVSGTGILAYVDDAQMYAMEGR
jgi:Polysaccharide deacetylase